MCTRVWAHMFESEYIWKSVDNLQESIPSFTPRFPGTELMLLGLVASVFYSLSCFPGLETRPLLTFPLLKSLNWFDLFFCFIVLGNFLLEKASTVP